MSISIGYKLQLMTMRHMSITGCIGQTMTRSSLTVVPIEPLCIQSSHINNIHFERKVTNQICGALCYIPMYEVPTMICHTPSFELGFGWKLVPSTYYNQWQGDTCPLPDDVVANPCQCDDSIEDQLLDVRNSTMRKQIMCTPMAKRHMSIIGRSGVAMPSSS